jgi:minor extracellular serine protease Vpr
VVVVKKRSYSIALVLALALISTPVLTWSSSGVKAQNRTTDGPPVVQTSHARPGFVSAIFTLVSDPVVTYMNSVRPAEERGGRIQLETVEAVNYESRLIAEQDSFRSRAALVSPNMRVVTQLRKLANAVSIEAPRAEIANIAALPGVRRVELTRQFHKTLDQSVPLIKAPALWAKLGGSSVAGQGIKIAILDTGIDTTNPLFSDAGFVPPPGFPRGAPFFVNNKVIAARAFLPDTGASPLDEDGHGTNVAGIAAGDLNTPTPIGLVSGVAPQAFLGNYRVLDATGSGPDDLIALGLETALSDGFDVANMSVGGPATDRLDFLSEAVENAVAAGMVVVIAAGNAGDAAMTITAPGIAPHAITVGASSNAHIVGSQVSVAGAAGASSGLTNIPAIPGIECVDAISGTFGPLPLFDVSQLDGKKRGCRRKRLPGGSLAGKLALVERGTCTFTDKINDLAQAGASGAIVFNKDISEGSDGGDNLVTMDTTGTDIPSVFISQSTGLSLKAWLGTHPGAQVAIAPGSQFAKRPDLLTAFSSRGPSSIGGLKPDVTAPGEFIYSGAIKTCNPSGTSDPSGFTSDSGTSQATPHVSGSVALLKQLNPAWTPAQIKSALVSTANPDVFLESDSTMRGGVLGAGAGRVDLSRAFTVGATFQPASLSFGFHKLGGAAMSLGSSFTITNVTSSQSTFTLTVQSLDPDPGVTAGLSSQSINLAPGQTQSVTLNISANASAPSRDYTGLVIVTGPDGQALLVPYWVGF